MYTNKQLTQTGRSRRTYSPEFKAQLVAACRIHGMSVASVARNHGINHNIMHRWLRELSDSGQPHMHSAVDLRPPSFIEVPMPQNRLNSMERINQCVSKLVRR